MDELTLTDVTAEVVVTPPNATEPADGWKSYNLTVCPVAGGACSVQSCTPADITYPTNNTCTLTGLSAFTQYNVTVRGRWVMGWLKA